MRLRDRAREVVDDVLDGGLQTEKAARQSAGAGKRLVQVGVELDSHERVEPEIADQRLGGLDGFQREGADACDGSEDRLAHAIVGRRLLRRHGGGMLHRRRGLRESRRRHRRGGRCGLRHRRKLRQRDPLAGQGRCLLLQHFRLLLQKRDLLAEQRYQWIHLGHLLRCGRQLHRC